jgi:histone-lysine N-methyltransferase SUV39H
LFSLDWSGECKYVVDAQKFGTITRFMNHSCNPNCKLIPVSTVQGDNNFLYDLAFFVLRDIPADTELTFDYNPEAEMVETIDPDAVKCLCGEENCRKQLWPNKRKGTK